jgi:hypothetical protein
LIYWGSSWCLSFLLFLFWRFIALLIQYSEGLLPFYRLISQLFGYGLPFK